MRGVFVEDNWESCYEELNFPSLNACLFQNGKESPFFHVLSSMKGNSYRFVRFRIVIEVMRAF